MTTIEAIQQPSPPNTSPTHRFNRHDGQWSLRWDNSKVRMYHDTNLDRVDYTEKENGTELDLPDCLFNRLLEERYPFSYYSTPELEKWWTNPNLLVKPPENKDDFTPLTYTDKNGNQVSLLWNNTRLRLYGESEYNHIELRLTSKNALGQFLTRTKGITDLLPSEWRILVREGYPIEYLPTIEMDIETKQWFERRFEEDGA